MGHLVRENDSVSYLLVGLYPCDEVAVADGQRLLSLVMLWFALQSGSQNLARAKTVSP